MAKKSNINQNIKNEYFINDEIYKKDENLLGVFSILLDVAKRTNPKKYLVGYKK